MRTPAKLRVGNHAVKMHQCVAGWPTLGLAGALLGFSLAGVKRATLIVMVLSGSPALFGVTTVLSFTQSIFEEAGAPIPEVASMLVIGVKVK